MKKKGQVGIVALVLIILIVLVAGLIIWNIVVPLVRERGERVERSENVLLVDLDVKEAVLLETGPLWVSVNRKTGGAIDELKFVFYDQNGESYVESKKDTLGELETRTYHFSSIPDVGKIEKVSVFPVFEGQTGREFETEAGKVLEVPDSLVSWWRLDDGSDIMGINPGIVEGSVSFVDDSRGKVASFSGGHINVGNHESLNINEEIAISMWIKGSSGSIIKKSDGNKNYEVSLNSGRKVVFSYTEGGVLREITSIDSVGSEWTHLVVSVDWSGVYKIYINGEEDIFGTLSEVPDTNEDNVLIGQGFQGSIDEVMMFNESLPIGQPEALYNHQK